MVRNKCRIDENKCRMNVLCGALVIAIGLAPGLPTMFMPGDPTANSVELAPTPVIAQPPARHGQRFYAQDTHQYTSIWFQGRHRKMIPFGCTTAPYYDPDPRCASGRGFHHGIDIAMPCGTRLSAGIRGVVVDPDEPGALGLAYGRHAFRIRNHALGVDVVIGHTRKVFVDPGDTVSRHESIALASDAGAPDGCHLHFEVRPIGGSYTSALNPLPLLRLARAD
jgi:murein DD-endopeptidase MepM/ murein hydrolase activator NlpD